MTNYVGQVNKLLDNGFIAPNTRSFIVSFTSYHIPTQYYTMVDAVFEWSQDFLLPCRMIVSPFRTPVHSDAYAMITVLVVRIILTATGVYFVFTVIKSK